MTHPGLLADDHTLVRAGVRVFSRGSWVWRSWARLATAWRAGSKARGASRPPPTFGARRGKRERHIQDADSDSALLDDAARRIEGPSCSPLTGGCFRER